MMAYAAENNQYLPASYNYRGTTVDPATGTQTPASATFGYIHWSGLLLGKVNPDAFKCPAIANGGLPATDPPEGLGNFDTNQKIDASTGSGTTPDGRVAAITQPDGTGSSVTYFPDYQAPRMAYSLNEALCGRNKYVVGFQGATRRYRNVQLTEIENQPGTILATELVDDWGIVSGTPRGGSGGVVCKSHRPIQPFRADNTTQGDAQADVSLIDATTSLRKTNATDLWHTSGTTPSVDIIKDANGTSPTYSSSSRMTRLDWVGRNHAKGEKPADNKSNFLYCDGHVETKHITETVPADATHQTPWEWGEKPYSVIPNTTNP
jgi:prepilin-type processing-associated H-X9-DG protein